MSAEDPRLRRYAEMLLERNRVLNLTGARDQAALWEHIDDSLTLLPHVRDPHVDIGSGGGFPGIPLAIASGVQVTLVESIAKKARFLEEVVAELGLRVTVLNARAEEVGWDARYRAHFASASCRAVAQASTVLEFAIPFLTIGGTVLLQRGKLSEPERHALSDAALMLGAQIGEEHFLPGSEEKRIIFVHKCAPTPARFPRRGGVPQKRPLCS